MDAYGIWSPLGTESTQPHLIIFLIVVAVVELKEREGSGSMEVEGSPVLLLERLCIVCKTWNHKLLGSKLFDISFSNMFFDMSPQARETK